MSAPILATKLYVPPSRPHAVLRHRLIERMNEGLGRRLTLVSAPAGFGKTTLVSEWAAACGRPVAWLSLDEGDNDLARFLAYFVGALGTMAPGIGRQSLTALQSPQRPATEAILTSLLNEISTIPDDFVLVLDDYHVVDARPVDDALTFLIEHLPPQMHLVLATREDPRLPLSRLRARDQLVELRAFDLRFAASEAAEFLNHVMRLNLSTDDITALEARTEGWIAGLQLAAISMQGRSDVTGFIRSFTGSHHFVLDYLVEEVLRQQSEGVQNFLLRTSILDRLCGPLCDAVLADPSTSGQETLEYLDRSNLFIVSLDSERRWYRYHHLFAEFLRQRLQQSRALSEGDEEKGVAELHERASQWYEENGLEIEAFRHAAAADDVERAARLIEGRGMPLQFRGALTPILQWLESLPRAVLDARPSLWVTYASATAMTGRLGGVEQKLQAAEAALHGAGPDGGARNLVGHIAAIRALLAAAENQVEAIISQSLRALEYLHPENLAVRTATVWKLGLAYQLQGNRAAARQAFTEAVAISEASGNTIINISSATGLGNVQEAENQLQLAARTYGRVLDLAGDPPMPAASEALLGLARIFYEWNDLDAAERHLQQRIQSAPQLKDTDRSIACALLHARLKLARGDVAAAATTLAEADRFAREHHFAHKLPEIAAEQAIVSLRQEDPATAAHLAETHGLALCRARVCLARGDAPGALELLELLRRQVEEEDRPDERLRIVILQAVAYRAHGDRGGAVQLLADVLALAEPGGFVRSFVDEGKPMARLLSEAAAHGVMPDYTARLLAVFEAQGPRDEPISSAPISSAARPLVEPLSRRELEVLRLVAQGLSNREIGERLFLALDTVKGHNRRIYGKLQVQRRTEALARARELGLL